ncbi:MAG: hypothetical protein IMZ61_14700 [Planctomycetes bacterium]|nr:hypothetical protein [Planctomycetota bacterium]
MCKWPKLVRYDPIEVHWDDISSISTWNSEEDADNIEPTKCTSVGYYLNRNDGALRISYSKNDNGGFSVEVIPAGCVTKIIVLGRRR